MALIFRDQYVATRKLGDALYGSVWLCNDTRNDTLVAVKQVSLSQAKQTLAISANVDNPAQERRVVRILSQLDGHENVVQFMSEFVEQGSWHVVMEYCDGDLLGRMQALSEQRALEADALGYFHQLMRGVDYLHSNGIAHRDLSLENVLVRDNVCKICDFGLSADSRRVCMERVGKAYYMAPEVVAELPYDPFAADMWSVGIILFIMLTGSPLVPVACHDDGAFIAFQRVGLRKVLDAWGMSAQLSSTTIELLVCLLELDPTKRPVSSEVVAFLEFDRA